VIATHDTGGSATDLEGLVDRLSEPRTLTALNTLVDNAELIAMMVQGLDELARRADTISDTAAEVIEELRAAGRATGMDVGETTQQLAKLIPTFAEAAPAIKRVTDSAIVQEDAVEVVGLTGLALSDGYAAAMAKDAHVGMRGLLQATRDEHVQRGLGLLIEVARALGRRMDEQPIPPSPTTPA